MLLKLRSKCNFISLCFATNEIYTDGQEVQHLLSTTFKNPLH